MARPTFDSVSDYIDAQPPRNRKALEQLRALVKKTLPKADEVISYQIPTYKEHGKAVIFFAGFKEHVAVYPVTAALLRKLGQRAEPYKHGRGTLRFPLDEPLPLNLIKRVAKLRAAENKAATEARNERR